MSSCDGMCAGKAVLWHRIWSRPRVPVSQPIRWSPRTLLASDSEWACRIFDAREFGRLITRCDLCLFLRSDATEIVLVNCACTFE